MADATIQVIIDAYTRGLEDGMKRAEQSTDKAADSMTARLADINQAAQLMQRTITDVSGIVGGIYDIGKEGAQLADLERRFARIMGGADAASSALKKLRTATKHTVSDAELMEQAMSLVTSGLADNAEEMAIIMKTVSALGPGAGLTVSAGKAMLDYTTMINNGLTSVRMRADDLGISYTNVETRMKELEKQGYSTRDALQQAVNEDMLRVYDEVGLGAETAATKMAQAETSLANFADEAKRGFIPVSSEIAGGLQGLVNLLWQTSDNIPVLVDGLYKIMAGLQGVLPLLEQFGLAWIELGHGLAALLSGDFAEFERRLGNFMETLKNSATVAGYEVRNAYESYVEMYKGVDEGADVATDSLGELVDETDEAAEKYEKFAEDVEKARQQLSDRLAALDLRDARRAEDVAIQAARRQEDIAIQTARRREDMARQLNASIAQAHAQAALSQAQAANQRAEALLNVERDYQKRLRDIQRDYALEASDAIKARDALALVRARERRDRELTEAQEQRQEARQDAERAYQQQLQQIQQALQLQIQAALEAHRQQEEDLQRSLRRQEEDEAISARRREEDARRSRMREEMDARAAFNAFRISRLQEYSILYADYAAHLSRMRAAGSSYGAYASHFTPSYQEGTPFVPMTGTYLLHQGEAVIPADQNPYAGGGGGMLGGVTINQNYVFQGSFSEAEKQWFRQTARQESLNALNEVIA